MDPLARPSGYLVEDEKAAEALLAAEAELLKLEGIDPSWPGFADELPDQDGREDAT